MITHIVGEIDEDINHRIRARYVKWSMKWRSTSTVLCHLRIANMFIRQTMF